MSVSGGLSRVSIGQSMAKDQGQIDNYFTPGSQAGRDGEEVGYLFTVILVALAIGAFGLVWGLAC